MHFLMIVEVDEAELDGDDSIENAVRVVNDALDRGTEGTVPHRVRPVSEVISA